MNKLALVITTAVSVLCFTTLAFAGSLAPGASMSCKDAKSITLASAGSSPGDRTNANFVIWKSSNFTTIPIQMRHIYTQGGGIHCATLDTVRDSKLENYFD